jgi:hypothetical protein
MDRREGLNLGSATRRFERSSAGLGKDSQVKTSAQHIRIATLVSVMTALFAVVGSAQQQDPNQEIAMDPASPIVLTVYSDYV